MKKCSASIQIDIDLDNNVYKGDVALGLYTRDLCCIKGHSETPEIRQGSASKSHKVVLCIYGIRSHIGAPFLCGALPGSCINS